MFLSVDDKYKYGTELCLTVLDALHIFQQLLHVCFRIVCIAGITGGIYTRCPTKGLHFQTGIIGKTIQMIVIEDISCFQQSISFKCVCSFRNVSIAFDILHAEKFDLLSQNGSYFFQFV